MNFRKAVFILIVIVILSVIHLYINTQNITIKYQVAKLKTEHNQLISQNRQLASQAASKENLGYIEKTAKEKLGMIYPNKMTYIVVTEAPAETVSTTRP
ncbi:MAG: septum formation initiator family protein [bacterium]